MIFVVPQDSLIVPAFAPDVVFSETHTLAVTATSHPVEKGANVTDHVRPEPKRYSASIFVSNTPLKAEGLFFLGTPQLGTRGGANTPLQLPPILVPPSPGPMGLLEPQAPIVITAAPLSFVVPFNAPRETYDYFEQLQDEAILCSIYTQTHDYTDMLCTSCTPVQGPSDGSGATIAIEFSQIRTVSTALVVAPIPLEPKGSPIKKAGTQSTTEEANPFAGLSKTLEKFKNSNKSGAAFVLDGGLSGLF